MASSPIRNQTWPPVGELGPEPKVPFGSRVGFRSRSSMRCQPRGARRCSRRSSGRLREGARSYAKRFAVPDGSAPGRQRYSPVRLMCSQPGGETWARSSSPNRPAARRGHPAERSATKVSGPASGTAVSVLSTRRVRCLRCFRQRPHRPAPAASPAQALVQSDRRSSAASSFRADRSAGAGQTGNVSTAGSLPTVDRRADSAASRRRCGRHQRRREPTAAPFGCRRSGATRPSRGVGWRVPANAIRQTSPARNASRTGGTTPPSPRGGDQSQLQEQGQRVLGHPPRATGQRPRPPRRFRPLDAEYAVFDASASDRTGPRRGGPAQALVQSEPALGEPVVRTGRSRQAVVGISDGGSRQQRLSAVPQTSPAQPAGTTPPKSSCGAPASSGELFGCGAAATRTAAGGRAGQGRGLCLRRWGVRAAGGRSEADDSRHRGREGDRSLITSPLLRRSAEHLSRGGGRSGRLSIPGRSGAEAGR